MNLSVTRYSAHTMFSGMGRCKSTPAYTTPTIILSVLYTYQLWGTNSEYSTLLSAGIVNRFAQIHFYVRNTLVIRNEFLYYGVLTFIATLSNYITKTYTNN